MIGINQSTGHQQSSEAAEAGPSSGSGAEIAHGRRKKSARGRHEHESTCIATAVSRERWFEVQIAVMKTPFKEEN